MIDSSVLWSIRLDASAHRLWLQNNSYLNLAHAGCRVEELLPARLRDAVETASVISAELQSLHRQHVTAGMLLQQEEARSRELAQELKVAQVPQSSSACSRDVVPAATRLRSS